MSEKHRSHERLLRTSSSFGNVFHLSGSIATLLALLVTANKPSDAFGGSQNNQTLERTVDANAANALLSSLPKDIKGARKVETTLVPNAKGAIAFVPHVHQTPHALLYLELLFKRKQISQELYEAQKRKMEKQRDDLEPIVAAVEKEMAQIVRDLAANGLKTVLHEALTEADVRKLDRYRDAFQRAQTLLKRPDIALEDLKQIRKIAESLPKEMEVEYAIGGFAQPFLEGTIDFYAARDPRRQAEMKELLEKGDAKGAERIMTTVREKDFTDSAAKAHAAGKRGLIGVLGKGHDYAAMVTDHNNRETEQQISHAVVTPKSLPKK